MLHDFLHCVFWMKHSGKLWNMRVQILCSFNIVVWIWCLDVPHEVECIFFEIKWNRMEYEAGHLIPPWCIYPFMRQKPKSKVFLFDKLLIIIAEQQELKFLKHYWGIWFLLGKPQVKGIDEAFIYFFSILSIQNLFYSHLIVIIFNLLCHRE